MNMKDKKKFLPKKKKKRHEEIIRVISVHDCFSDDIVFNCLARISRIHHPTLSLVSKSFRSLMASRELHATRTLIGKTEDCLYACLDLNKKKNPNPRWFTLGPISKQHRLLPLVPNSFPISSTIVSMGSEMYLIGGLVNKERSTRVSVVDFQSHQWRSLPDMIVPRDSPAADGKIYVIGGCRKDVNIEHWGEVYEPNTQTWETLSPTTLDHLITQKTVVMDDKVYDINGLKLNLKEYHVDPYLLVKYSCLVEIETNVWCEIYVPDYRLLWRDPNDENWMSVTGLEKLSIPNTNSLTNLVWVANSGGRRWKFSV